MERFDAIIIGSGIGGLAMGAILSTRRPGLKVLILEKNSFIGGRVSSWQKEGFTLDIGSHVISRSDKGPIGEILRMLGKEDKVRWEYVRPMTSYKGRRFPFPKGIEGMIPDRDLKNLMAMFRNMMTLDTAHTSELDEIDLRSYVVKFTENPLVHACINNVCLVYFCVPYDRASAGEFLRCIRAEAGARASGYPHGGCGAISNAFVEGIKERGVKIITNAKVDRVIIENSTAKGVTVQGKEFFAPVIISNADIKHTLINLVGEDQLTKDHIGQIRNLEFSYSGLVLRVALDKVLADWKLLTHIGTDDPKYCNDLEGGKIPNGLFLFSPIPSNFSPEVAPEGQQLLSSLVMIPFGFKNLVGLKEAMIDTIEDLLPGFRKHIMWMEETTPSDMNRLVGAEGAICGTGLTVRQSGKKRPGVETPIKNLYLCGANAGGWGVGTEMAIESAKIVSSLIT